MKTQFTNTPNRYEIEHIEGNKCIVAFYDLSTIHDVIHEEETSKECDVYKIELIHNISYIENKYNSLLNLAKQIEYDKLAKEVRAKRDKLLAETDYLMCSDVVCDKTKVAQYRQALRDITNQDGFPYSVEYPEL